MVGDSSLTESGGAVVPASKATAVAWSPKVKRYRHFDRIADASSLKRYAMDPANVSRHPFYPLISFQKRWTSYSVKGVRGEEKSRSIKYACRADAAIFSCYRSILAEPYEAHLAAHGISSSVLAYRRMLSADGRGKCNIDFALSAFEKVRSFQNCSVAALDISGFFDNLDHSKIKRMWCRLFGWSSLPQDHYSVFKHITRYAEVDLDVALRALGIKGDVELNDGSIREGFIRQYADVSPQLCYPDDFRSKIVQPKLIKSYADRGFPKFGVPQGVPLSDLLANLYMIDFDRNISRMMAKFGGYYARYSDDIVLIAPQDEFVMARFINVIDRHLGKMAPRLKIKGSKTEFGVFKSNGASQTYQAVIGKSGGFRYLGFRYDGSAVYLRDQTISNLWRKTAKICNREAVRSSRRYPDKAAVDIWPYVSIGRIVEKTGKVEQFFAKEKSYSAWTFWTYAKRAHEAFSGFGSGIKRQLRNHQAMVTSQMSAALERAVRRRDDPLFAAKRKKRLP